VSENKIEFCNLWKTFDEVQALKDVSYSIREKEFFVLFGPSGAGKTTTLKVIAGLEYASAGELLLDKEYANYRSPQERNVRMAFENYSLYPHFTVYRNISSPLVVKGVDKKEIDNRVKAIAKTLGIDNYLNRLPRELSGGQKQRVALGRALITESDIYLLDEPLAHLDAKIRNELRAEFQNIKSFLSNSTVVYVTHDYLEALSLGDRIGVIREGEIIQVDEPLKIYHEPDNIFVAQLFGQPEINLIEGAVKNEAGKLKFSTEDFTMEIPAKSAALIKEKDCNQVIFGCRPQHWLFSQKDPKKEDYFKAKVEAFEGRNYKGVILTSLGKTLITILCESYEKITENSNIWIKPDIEHMYFFDKSTGQNLTKNY
jgi:multiple sugar transport system ATP-binding protein